MKSQVNALLHVMDNGICKDVISTYPALKGSLSKDMDRLALYCQNRGLGVFTLDLPNLKTILLDGLKTGRLRSEGPLSSVVSKKVRVPRLFSGLWLRVFDRDACLKHEVDTTALFMLRALLEFGSKIEVECSHNRKSAVMEAYYGVESRLRRPSLDWESDTLGLTSVEEIRPCVVDSGNLRNHSFEWSFGSERQILHRRVHYSCSCSIGDHDLLASRSIFSNELVGDNDNKVSRRSFVRPMQVHLVQAHDGSSDLAINGLPLFEKNVIDRPSLLEDQRLLRQIQRVADLVVSRLGDYDPIEYSAQMDSKSLGIGFKHGPGAVAEKMVRWEKSQFPNWPHKLQGTFPFESCGSYAGSGRTRPSNHEVASRLLGVPKTAKGPRLIAAEPTAHQWCQQLTWKWIREQCSRIFGSDFICFTDQSLSGRLVLEASRNGELATVDLSEASDRLSCWTVERMFRCNPSLLTALHAARTRYLRDTVSKDGGFLSLRKFASQGTATTFPIMSLVMLFIALGSTLYDERITWDKIVKSRNQVRVFGDDIILPTRGYVRLCRAMDLLQLKINMAKSYADGKFRESCGVDGYDGYDVTPIRPKTLNGDSPTSCQAVVDTSTNLFMKGLWHASTACMDLLPARLRRGIRIVGPHDVGFRGLPSFSGGYESHLIQRWNPSLHRNEVRVWSTVGQTLKRPREGHSALLDFFASKHNYEFTRNVSEFADVRKTRIGFLWEPANSRSYVPTGSYQTQSSRGVFGSFPKKLRDQWPLSYQL